MVLAKEKNFVQNFIIDMLDVNKSNDDIYWVISISNMAKLINQYCIYHKLERPKLNIIAKLMADHGIWKVVKRLKIYNTKLIDTRTNENAFRNSTIRCWDHCRAKNTSGILGAKYEN